VLYCFMNFAALLETIASASLRNVAIHWNEARKGRRMPNWSDIKPARFPAELPIIWAYKYHPESRDFIGRFAGERICQIFGKSFRGLPLAEAHPPEAFAWVHGLCVRVVTEPAMYRSCGQVFKRLDRPGYGERLMLPLSTDDVHGDGILGATEYHYLGNTSRVAQEIKTENECWGSLRPTRQRD
jgi:hypothetical protein